MVGKSPIKWRQGPDMTIAVDWDEKHLFKQTNKATRKLTEVPKEQKKMFLYLYEKKF